ncbi:MAG: MotA/TolQ/ExbB proton channel family protein [Chlamydiales bacterium]|nr:MotA/TolQ/ExbB proton channel family protein [Chlamydiales bacterium]
MHYIAISGLIFKSYAASDFFGKAIFMGLFFLSILCWIVLIQKSWVLYQIKKSSPQFQAALEKQKNNILQIPTDLFPKFIWRDIVNPYAEIYLNVKQRVIDILKKNHFFLSKDIGETKTNVFLTKSDIELIDLQLNALIDKQVKCLEKNLFILSMIVSLAPFLGILGTVWGILISLFEMQNGGGSFQSNSVILSGLSTALATTVLGLVIAIPALVCYSYLKNMIKNIYSDMNHFAYDLLSHIELQYRNVELKQ